MVDYIKYNVGDASDVKGLKALVACEYSRTTADILESRGIYTVSCDILDPDKYGIHYKGDVMDIINDGWDLLIGHPPCTYLAVSGARWLYHPDDKNLPKELRRPHPKFPNREQEKIEAFEFFMSMYDSNIPYVALENPVSMLSSMFRKPDFVAQPYHHGDPVSKKTCFWLKGLPIVSPTNVVVPEVVKLANGNTYDKWWYETCSLPVKGGVRSHARNRSFPSLMKAVVDTWVDFIIEDLQRGNK